MSTTLSMDNINNLGNDSSCSSGYADEIAIRNSSSRNNGNLILNIPGANKGLAVCGLLGVIFVAAALIHLNNKINELEEKNKSNTTTPNVPVYNPNGYYTYNPNGYYVQPNPYANPVDPNTYIKK